MSQQAKDYAVQLEAICNDVLSAVDAVPQESWTILTSGEQWTVGVAALHIAEVQGFFDHLFKGLVADPTNVSGFTQEQVDAMNHHRAVTRADVTKDEGLELLRTNGPEVIKTVASLTDEQLALNAGNFCGNDTSIGILVQFGLIAHFQEHLASIRINDWQLIPDRIAERIS